VKTYEFQGRVLALSSITHNGGQSFGINQKLRREKFVQPDSTVEEVPVISGNSLRGHLRDVGMLHMCRMLGYGEPDAQGRPTGLQEPAFYFLFSGGSLVGNSRKAVNIEEARKIISVIPLVAIFGGANGNQTLPSKLKMGKMIPICQETAHVIPEAFLPPDRKLPSVWDYCQEEMYTRKDDEKNEKLRQVLSPEARLLIDGQKAEKQRQKEAGIPVETGQSQQMMYYIETLAAGTPFYLRIILDDVTDVEFEAFLTTLVEFSRKPFVGGKSGIGLGYVSLTFDRWFEIDSRLSPKGEAISRPAGQAYASHLKERGPEIRDLLSRIKFAG